SLFSIFLACAFEREGMQCKARRAAQGRPLSKRRNAAMRTSRSNPSGNPGNRPPAVLRLLAVARGRRARHDASPRLAFDRFPGLRACQKDTEQALSSQVLYFALPAWAAWRVPCRLEAMMYTRDEAHPCAWPK
ncbi:hypothetical protein, partial [Noviherbaspirillum agri]